MMVVLNARSFTNSKYFLQNLPTTLESFLLRLRCWFRNGYGMMLGFRKYEYDINLFFYSARPTLASLGNSVMLRMLHSKKKSNWWWFSGLDEKFLRRESLAVVF